MAFNYSFAERLSNAGTDSPFAVGIEVAALERAGRKITKMHIGQPDFPTPENVKEAAVKAIREDKTGYTTSNGIFELRQTVAEELKKRYGVDVDPEGVVITPGTKPMLFMAAFALLNPGDEAVVPNPGYGAYQSSVYLAGAKPVSLPIVEEKNFSFDHEALKNAVTKKTKLLMLNTPANPTGGVLARDDLKVVRDLVLENKQMMVLSDEIYARIVYDGKHESIYSFPEIADRVIYADGWGKAYSMTGWRMGFGAMPVEVAKKVASIAINTYSGVVNFNQYACIEAYKGPQDRVEAMVREFDARRKLIVQLLNEIDGVSCLMPKGAFYAFPNVKEISKRTGKNSHELQHWLLHEHGLAVLAGSAFGSLGEGYLRFSYAASQDAIREGVEKTRKALETI
ncbi:MAG: pyridoxal phosphate-dependent aminotransferase [Candidatus Norongarragalinales archaeon]